MSQDLYPTNLFTTISAKHLLRDEIIIKGFILFKKLSINTIHHSFNNSYYHISHTGNFKAHSFTFNYFFFFLFFDGFQRIMSILCFAKSGAKKLTIKVEVQEKTIVGLIDTSCGDSIIEILGGGGGVHANDKIYVWVHKNASRSKLE